MWSLSLWHNLHKTCCVHARLATADHSKAEKTIFATQAFLIGHTCVLRLAETYYAVTNGASWRCASFCQFWWLECESNENKRSLCKSMLTIHSLDYGFPCQLQMLHAFMTSHAAEKVSALAACLRETGEGYDAVEIVIWYIPINPGVAKPLV